MPIINSLRSVIKQTPNYKKWDEAQNDKEAGRAYLAEHNPVSVEELKDGDKFGRAVINAINIMDEKSEDAATKTESTNQVIIGVGLQAVSLPYSMFGMALAKNDIKTFGRNGAILSAAIVALSVLANAWGTSQEVFASKIAREKARSTELKDPKNFIIYDDAQIESAKKKVEVKGKIKEKKPAFNIKESFNHLKTLFTEKKAYKLAAQQRAKTDAAEAKELISIKASPEQLAKAEKTQETVLRVIKKINNEAEDYSENIESATGAFLGFGFIADGLFAGTAGLLTKSIMENVKIPPRVKSLLPQVATLITEKVKMPPSVSSFLKLTAEKVVSLPFKSFLPKVIGGVAFVGGIITEATIAQKMKLNAAKVGRFKVKQELLSDPKNFISYTDKELESVKEIKAPKQKKVGFFKDLFGDLKFLWNARKDFKAYNDYKKNELPKEKAYLEELKKSEVSKEQLDKGKSLQHKLFGIFEKIDDKSQEYSEDMEFTTQTVRQLKAFLPYITGGAVALAGIALAKFGAFKVENLSKIVSKVFFQGTDEAKTQVEGLIKNGLKLKGSLTEEQKYETTNNVLNSIGKLFFNGKKLTLDNPEELVSSVKAGLNGKIESNKFLKFVSSKIKGLLSSPKFINYSNKLAEEIAAFSIKPNLQQFVKFPTLFKSGLVAGGVVLTTVLIPFVAVNFAINYAIESFFTSIQKTAGKIGVMEAIKGLDDPRAFLDESEKISEPKNDMEQFLLKLNKAS